MADAMHAPGSGCGICLRPWWGSGDGHHHLDLTCDVSRGPCAPEQRQILGLLICADCAPKAVRAVKELVAKLRAHPSRSAS